MKPLGEPIHQATHSTLLAKPALANWAVAGGCAFLLLAVVAVFGQTIGFDFVNFDDNLYVYDNPNLAKGLSVEGVAWAFSATEANNWHPLTWLSLLLDYSLFGRNAWGYHLMNVLLHAANAILLFLVLRRMTGEFWPSLLAAAVFAVHPLRVESVAWVSERKDVLAGLFFMLTLWAYAGYARRPFSDRGLSQFSRRDSRPVEKTLDRRENGTVPLAPREGDRSMFSAKGFFAKYVFRPKNGPVPTIHWLRYSAVAVLFALGLMAKPMLVTLPFVLLLLDFWPLGRFSGSLSLRRLLLEKLPLFMLSAVSCWVTYTTQGDALKPLEHYAPAIRIGNALVSYASYIGQTFYPAGLAAYYPHPRAELSMMKAILAALFLAGITGAAVFQRRRRPWLFVGWFWYVGMLVPVIGLVQVGHQAMADRYTYLPQIGLLIVLFWAVRRAVELHPRWTWVTGAVAAPAVVACMICSWRQTTYWADGEALWNRVLACTSENAVAHNNLGVCLRSKGRDNEAMEHYQKALDLNPYYAEAYQNIGNILAESGLLGEAVVRYNAALAISPRSVGVRCHLGAALAAQGRYEDAIRQWSEVIGVQPDKVAVLKRLAWTLATCPDDSVRDGPRAAALAERAVRLTDGRDARALDVLAAAYAESGRFREAVDAAHKALLAAASCGKDSGEAEAVRNRLELYRAGSAYRAPGPPGVVE